MPHHPRSSISMEGGTTFHFVTDGIESALAQAIDAAGGADVRIGGGAATVQQNLRAGLIDEMAASGSECIEFVKSSGVVHARVARTSVDGS